MLTGSDLNQFFVAFASRLTQSPQSLQRSYYFDPFCYTIDFITSSTKLPASGSVIGQFLVQNDSAFALCKQTYFITSTSNAAIGELQPFGSGLTTGLVPVTVTQLDSGSGRVLSNSAIPIDSLYGTGQQPNVLVVPKILDPNSMFQVTLTNLAATDYYVRLAHHGFKIFGDIQGYMNVAKGAGPINY